MIGCIGSGGGGSDGGSNPNNTPTYGGGGSGDGPLVTSPNPCSTCFPEDDDPCNQLEKIAMDIDFKNKLIHLRDNVNQATSTNLNFETAYVQAPTDSTATAYAYSYHQGSPNGETLPFTIPPGGLISGFFHTHYDINQHSSFSLDDIKEIYDMARNGDIFDNTFTAIVITKHGTTYALKFNNAQSLINFGDLWFDMWWDINPNQVADFYDNKSEKIRKKFKKIKATNSIAKNEKRLAKFLDKYNVGMSLYKSNANFTQWEKVNKNGTKTPCN